MEFIQLQLSQIWPLALSKPVHPHLMPTENIEYSKIISSLWQATFITINYCKVLFFIFLFSVCMLLLGRILSDSSLYSFYFCQFYFSCLSSWILYFLPRSSSNYLSLIGAAVNTFSFYFFLLHGFLWDRAK